MRNKALLLTLALLASTPGASAEADILSRLESLPGVATVETTTGPDRAAGYRRFSLQIEQPVDHFRSSSPTFRQKLVLFHRGEQEPMVLQTSGYSIFGERLSRLANAFLTNQIQVEHRYFSGSTPSPADWSKLTIRQSAEDFHRITETFKAIYPGRWVGTGASKGGMTSLFHRRFHPGDVYGTLADVTPLSFSLSDERYVDFVDSVGGPAHAQCREKLQNLQSALLARRSEILPLMDGTFERIEKEAAYEAAVIEMPFAYWQYKSPQDPLFGCDQVPAPSAPPGSLWAFLRAVSSPSGYGDSEVAAFGAYFYQCANEIGYPAARLDHLQEAIRFPFTLDPYLPTPVRPTFSDAAARDIQAWARTQSSRMMFFYGEYDPWSATTVELPPAGANETFQYWIAGGNHSANFTLLPAAAKTEVLGILASWLDKAPAIGHAFALTASTEDKSLEALELKALQEGRRPRECSAT